MLNLTRTLSRHQDYVLNAGVGAELITTSQQNVFHPVEFKGTLFVPIRFEQSSLREGFANADIFSSLFGLASKLFHCQNNYNVGLPYLLANVPKDALLCFLGVFPPL